MLDHQPPTQEQAVEIMRKLFTHVSSYTAQNEIRSFNVEAVKNYSGTQQVYIWGCLTTQQYQHISYEDNGVKINYHAGIKTRKGDTDWFIDETVSVDGHLIYKSV